MVFLPPCAKPRPADASTKPTNPLDPVDAQDREAADQRRRLTVGPLRNRQRHILSRHPVAPKTKKRLFLAKTRHLVWPQS